MTVPVPARGGGTIVRLLSLLVLVVCAAAGPAAASPRQPQQPQSPAGQVVVIGVPGLRWSDVQASPELTALLNESDVGSIAVKAAGPQSCPVDGWLTVSAGTRAWGSDPGESCDALPTVRDGRIPDWQEYVDRQREHRTGAALGRIGESGRRVCGFGPGAALALAKEDGTVSGWQPEVELTRLKDCPDAIVDAGPLPLREGRTEARQKLADLVRRIAAQGGRILLVGISAEAMNAHRELMVALQTPPEDGPRWLTSGSTRRPGLIQLTDLTATVLRDDSVGGPLDGDEISVTGDPHTDAAAVITDRLDTNERFEQPRPMLPIVVLTLLVVQLPTLAWFLITRTRRARRAAVYTLLAEGGFFVSVFLATVTSWWRWPSPGLALYLVAMGICFGVAALAYAGRRRCTAVVVTAIAFGVLLADGVLGTPLQVGSMFTDGPVFGGRFYGFGNSTFAAFAVATLVTAGWVAQRFLDRSRLQAAAAVLAIGGIAVLVDGVPGWGTDFGGVIALTPAVLLLAWLAWRGSISWRALAGIALTGFVAVTAFALVDYARPPAERSHFGTFVARLLDGEVSDVLIRKLEVSASVFTGPWGWAMLVAVLLAIAAVLFPQRVPSVTYRRFLQTTPMARPTLLALAACGVIGALLNDDGIVVPAIMTGFVLPLLVAHLVENATALTPEPRRLPVEVSE